MSRTWCSRTSTSTTPAARRGGTATACCRACLARAITSSAGTSRTRGTRIRASAGDPWPGIEIFTAEGHTRGQQLVRVHGPEGAVYFVADLIPTASHVRLAYIMGYDVAAIETLEEKRAMLARAAAERAWVCLEHDPKVALARPVPDGEEFRWEETIPAVEVTGAQAAGRR